MSLIEFQYAVEVFNAAGQSLGAVPIAPDWQPAFESANLQAIRLGRLPAVTTTPVGRIEPIWHPTLAPPYLAGFRAVLPDGTASEIETGYVRSVAQRAFAEFVTRGALQAGEVFTYLVCAYPRTDAPTPGPPPAVPFSVAEVGDPLPLVPASLRAFRRTALPCGDLVDGDLAVFVPQDVLDDAQALARGAADLETAGVLIGALHRDTESPEIFVEITALIPAPHTTAHATQVTFTAETWAAVDTALALRRRGGERKIGWAHSHPFWCRNCPAENRARCRLSTAFFSADDVHLHHVCFSRAYHVALLVSEDASGTYACALFGWRRGLIEARGFYVLGAPGADRRAGDDL